MKSLINKQREFWADKDLASSGLSGVVFLLVSLFVNYWAVTYAIGAVGGSTTDILLDNLPVINTDIIFSEGALLFVLFVACLVIFYPKKLPFLLKSIALFVCIRAMFTIMTHLGASPNRILTDFDKIKYISSSGADLFFSGHTGLPYLLALVFWQNRNLRILFISSSIIAAVAVILGHLHYTIDVFSAFFITYGIFCISKELFQSDYQLFKEGLPISKIV